MSELTIGALEDLPEGTLVGYEKEVWRRTGPERGPQAAFENLTGPQWEDYDYETLGAHGLYWYAFDIRAQRSPLFLLVPADIPSLAVEYDYAWQFENPYAGVTATTDRNPWRWYSTGGFWSILDWGQRASAEVAHTVRKVRRVKAGEWEVVEAVPMPVTPVPPIGTGGRHE